MKQLYCVTERLLYVKIIHLLMEKQLMHYSVLKFLQKQSTTIENSQVNFIYLIYNYGCDEVGLNG